MNNILLTTKYLVAKHHTINSLYRDRVRKLLFLFRLLSQSGECRKMIVSLKVSLKLIDMNILGLECISISISFTLLQDVENIVICSEMKKISLNSFFRCCSQISKNHRLTYSDNVSISLNYVESSLLKLLKCTTKTFATQHIRIFVFIFPSEEIQRSLHWQTRYFCVISCAKSSLHRSISLIILWYE